MELQKLINKYVYWPEVQSSYQKNIDFSNASMGGLHPVFKQFLNEERSYVTDDIIRFYGLNEILSKVRQDSFEILDDDAIKLYHTYHDEIEHQSQKMLAYLSTICLMESRFSRIFGTLRDIESHYVLDKRYGSDNGSEEGSHLKLKEEYKENAKRYWQDAIELIVEFNPGVDKEKFIVFMNLIAHISGDGTLSRHEIKKEMLNIFEQEPYSQLSIGEILGFSQVLFEYHDFESGFGGPAWSKIAQHAQDFVSGKINAEVFLDQAFSLEHNSGQIFNKDIIYHVVEHHAWSLGNLEQNFYANNELMLDSNFLLNAQHQGLLLSFANTHFDFDDTLNHTISSQDAYDKFKDQFNLIEREISARGFYDAYMTAQKNVLFMKELATDFQERHPAFLKLIKDYSVSLPEFNFSQVLNNGKNMEGGVIYLSEGKQEFCKLVNEFNIRLNEVSTHQNHTAIEPLDVQAYQFTFELLNTQKIDSEHFNKNHLGNKAFGLAQMQSQNLPVPKALVLPTTNARSYYQEKDKWLHHAREHFNTILDSFHLMPFSVRSGAAVSMPGMMDTILNVGIDDSNYEILCEKMGKKVIDKSIIKFMELFTKSVTNKTLNFSDNLNKALFQFRRLLEDEGIEQDFDNRFPLNAKEQLEYCLQGVFSSWYSERAKAYRAHHGIDDNMGTAAIIQQMVFGNMNEQSCTGVLFSRDCINGKKGIIGEFLINAQGEDVVSGTVTPQNIQEMQRWNPTVYAQLVQIAESLEKQTGEIQDIEFTVENGQLYILQKRRAVCSPQALFNLSQELHEQGIICKEDVIKTMEIENLLSQTILDSENEAAFAQGLVGNPGIIRGIVVRNEYDMDNYLQLYQHLSEQTEDKNFGWIFVSNETTPEHASLMLKTDAFLTGNGGFTSHAAILARSWNKPCVVGIGQAINELESGQVISMDAYTGQIYQHILGLKQTNEQQAEKMVKEVLNHYHVNLNELTSFSFESKPFWTQKYETGTINAQKKQNQEKRFDSFLSLGQRVAIMLLKEQQRMPTTQTVKNKIQAQREKHDSNDSLALKMI